MNLQKIAYKNVKQNMNRYIVYIASMSFTVMIFYLYISLMTHPKLSTSFIGANNVKIAMKAAAIVIAVFTFIFLLFSATAFLRSRKKEFGLLSLLGISKRQLSTIIIWENIIIGAMALGIGISFGILFQKLFLMVVSALIHLPDPLGFYLSTKIILTTIITFGTLFLMVAIFSLKEILKTSLVDLIKAGKKPKKLPRHSKTVAVLGVLLILTGYALAFYAKADLIPLLVLPVIAITCLGTYLAMKEATMAILALLRKNRRYFFRTDRFLNVSHLSFKMKDNYRTMSSVTILVAVILTALGTIFTVYSVIEEEVLANYPNSYELAGDKTYFEGPAQAIEKILLEEGIKAQRTDLIGIKSGVDINVIFKSSNIERRFDVIILPCSYYESQKGQNRILKDDEALLLNYYYYSPEGEKKISTDTLIIGGEEFYFNKIYTKENTLVNQGHYRVPQFLVNDTVYKKMQAVALETVNFRFYNTKQWKTERAAIAARRIKEEVVLPGLTKQEPYKVVLSTSPDLYEESQADLGFALFVGFLVTLVFFAACCSLLYFRLFTEIDEDRKNYQRLRELGLSSKEMQKITLKQVLIIFMLPYLFAIGHSFFALSALSTIAEYTVLKTTAKTVVLSHGILITLLYLLLYTLYFFTAFSVYWKSLSKAELK